MKVLIITYYWPPSGGSGVQRWLKFVKYLRNLEITPIIYTVKNPDYPILDESLLQDIPEDIEVIKKPIFEPSRFFKIFLKKSANLNLKPIKNTGIRHFFFKLLIYLRANFFIPDARKFWINPSVSFLKKYIIRNDVKAVISTGPPHSTHLIGLKLKSEIDVTWIADFRDPWLEIDYFHHLPLNKRSIKMHKKLEESVLKSADEILVVSPTMKKKYETHSRNVHLITNGFDGDLSDETNLDKEFTITHIGTINADRNAFIFWKALSQLKDLIKCKVQLIGKVSEEVKVQIKKYGLEDSVSLIDYLPHCELKNYREKSQLLLILINDVPNAKGIVTGKIFEYLQAKRPIIAIAPPDGDLAEIIYSSNAGFVVDFCDLKQLKRLFLELYQRYEKDDLKLSSVGIEKYHRKKLTQQLADIIKKN